jgi:hypothetical protein
MYLDVARISVSVTSVELLPKDGGSRLVVTVQGADLDGLDDPAQREWGTASQIDGVGALLERQPTGP